jgi:CrcB protein
VINVTGSFILGLVVGLAQYHGLGRVPVTVIGTGFCGAFTTFSTFSYESIRLLERGAVVPAATNTIGSVVVGLLAAGAGLALVGAL